MPSDKKKIPTIYDLAKALGVSIGTVNRALHDKPDISPETKRRVLEMAEKMNFKLNPVAQSMRRRTFHIAAVNCCTVKDFTWDVLAGIRSGLEQIGEFNIVGNDFALLNPYTDDFNTKLDETADKYISEGIDAVILHTPADNDIMRNYVKKLQKKDILVACVTSKVTSSDVLYVSIDSESAGHLAGEVLNLCCPGGKVGILIGTTDMSPHEGYLKGFHKINEECPFESVHVYTHLDEEHLVEETTRKMFQEHQDLSGVYIATASSEVALKVIEDIHRENPLHIVATDLLPETKRSLQNRTIRAIIFQDPFLQGKSVLELVYRHLCHETDEKEVLLSPRILFPSDVK